MANAGGSVLCLFSGGIDSTGALHKLVTEDQYLEQGIIVHHIHMLNIENRATAESAAVNSILDYYRSYAEDRIVFTESTFDSLGFKNLRSKRFPFDSDVQGFIAGNICAIRPDIKSVAFGRTKTDIEGLSRGFVQRMLRLQQVFDSVLLMEPKPHAKFIFPVSSYVKKEIWEFLPKEVREHTWWCRRPVYENGDPIPCRKCPTCKEVLEFHNF